MSDSSPNTRPNFNPSQEETTFLTSPLGLQNPLLPLSPLGQNFLSPKFLSPLGAKSLTNITSLASPRSEMPESNWLDSNLQDTSVLDSSLSRLSEPVTVQTSLANLDATAVGTTSLDQTVIQPFSETEVAVEGKEEIQKTTESVQQKSVPIEPAQTDIEEQNTTLSDLTAVQPLLETELPQPNSSSIVEVTESAIASQPTELSNAANIAPSPLVSESSSSVTTPPQQPIIPTLSDDSPTPTSLPHTTPTQSPVVQAFSESSLTQSEEVVPTPTQEAIISDENSPPQSEPVETEPTQNPIVQTFSQQASTPLTVVNPSPLAPTEPTLTESVAAEDKPSTDSAFADTTFKPEQSTPVLDSSTASTEIQTLPTQSYGVQRSLEESPVQFEQTSTTADTPSLAIPALPEDFSPQSEEIGTINAQEPSLSTAFLDDSTSHYQEAEIVPPQQSIVQTFSDNTSTIPSPISEPLAALTEPTLTKSVLAETPPTQELDIQNFAQTHSTQTPTIQTFSESSQVQSEQADTIPTQFEQVHTSADISPTQQSVVQAFSENTLTESIAGETTSTQQSNIQASSEQAPTTGDSSEETPFTSTEPTHTESLSPEITPTQETIVSAFSEESPTQFNDETSPIPESVVQTFSTDSSIQSNSAETIAPEQPVSQTFSPDFSTASEAIESIPIQEPRVQSFSPDSPTQSSSVEATPPEQAISPASLSDSVTESTAVEPTLTSQPTIQPFSEDSRAVSEAPESTLIQEPSLQTSSPDSPTPFNENEAIPTQESVIQAFSEDAPTPSDSTEAIPSEQPVSPSFLPDSAIDSAVVESTLTSQPTIQPFLEGSRPPSELSESTSIQQPSLQTFTPDSPTPFNDNEALPTQESVVQAFSEDIPTSSGSTEAIPPEQPISPSFLEDSAIDSAALETLPTPQPVAQGFAESSIDESVAEGVTSPQPTVVQPLLATQALPQLPTVLDNVASFQPLGSAKPLAQSSDFLTSSFSSGSSGGQSPSIQRRLAEPLSSNPESIVQSVAEPVVGESVATQTSLPQDSIVQAFLEPVPTASSEIVNEVNAAPMPSTPNEEIVAETSTDSEPTVVQAFSETETMPQLSTVLENLAPQQPLGSSHPLVQLSDFPLGTSAAENSGEQPAYLQRKLSERSDNSFQDNVSISSLATVQVPSVRLAQEASILQRFTPEVEKARTSNSNPETQQLSSGLVQQELIPNAWSSISELLSGFQSNSTPNYGGESTVIQKMSSSSETSNLLQFDNLISQENSIENLSNSNLISPFTEETNTTEQGAKIEEIPLNDNASAKEDSRNLEILAREIYGLIRQRLEIDRERRGSYYSDRLPW